MPSCTALLFLGISFFVKGNANWNKHSLCRHFKKSNSVLMGRERGLLHASHSFPRSVLNYPVCNFPSCHCGVLIKEAIGTVNILTSNQPNPLPPLALLTNINQFIYSQEVTSRIWQVITSLTVCVCEGVHLCRSLYSPTRSWYTPVHLDARKRKAHNLCCASVKSWVH